MGFFAMSFQGVYSGSKGLYGKLSLSNIERRTDEVASGIVNFRYKS